MTDLAIRKQLDALNKTTQEALKSKEASLQLLINLRLVTNVAGGQSNSNTSTQRVSKHR